MEVQRFAPVLVIVIAAFGLVSPAVLCAQGTTAGPLQFSVPYQCRNGKTLTVRSCEMRQGVEMCAYDRDLKGQPLHPAYVRRSTLEDWLHSCQPTPGEAFARPTGAPTAAGAAPPATPRSGVTPGGAQIAAATQSTNVPYLAQFPSVERVKAEMQGKDAMDTAARQMGAFWQLQEIIKGMSGLRWTQKTGLTADENRLLGQYAAAYYAAGQPYDNYPDRPAWYKAHAFYETNRDFRDELFRRLLTPAIQAQWAQVTGDTRAQVEASRAQRQAETSAPVQPPAGFVFGS